MGYNWKLGGEINAGNMGNDLPYADRGETRLEPSSSKNYTNASAAFMKYEIRVPVGNTSIYEETVVVLEPMTAFFDDGDGHRSSKLFKSDVVKGHKIVKKFYDAAKSLYSKHKKKFSTAEKKNIEESLAFAKSYLGKVSGAIDYWADHSLLWPIDQLFKDFGYGACTSFLNAGKVVEDVVHPEYPEIKVDVLCPTAAQHASHDADRAKAGMLLDISAAHVRYVERYVWPKEVEALNAAALSAASPKKSSKKVSLPGSAPTVKLVTVNAESIEEVGGGGSGKTSKKKKKSVLPLVAVAGIGALLLMRK